MININQINKSFSSHKGVFHAIDGASLTISQDEILVLLGPSGSGKTTLLRCVAGLETADSGSIEIGGQVVFSSSNGIDVPPERRRIGMVFQSYAIWPHLSVEKNVSLPLTHGRMGVSAAESTKRVRQALRSVQMSEFADRPAPFLSGGQQQRVALARALAVEPDALLMDEPLSNLDARLREEVRVEIRSLSKQMGVPVLYVTHDQVEAMDLADRVAVMDRGRILQVGTPEAVYNEPVNPTVASFLGSMNWVDGEQIGERAADTPIGRLIVSRAVAGKSIRIGVRPENVRLSRVPTEGPNQIRGRCVSVSFLGDHRICRVSLAGTDWSVKIVDRTFLIDAGADVFLDLPPQDLLVFAA